MFQKAHAAAILPANMWKSAPRRPFRVKIRKFPHPLRHPIPPFQHWEPFSVQKKSEIWSPNAARSLLEPVFGSEIVTRVHAALNCNPSARQVAQYSYHSEWEWVFYVTNCEELTPNLLLVSLLCLAPFTHCPYAFLFLHLIHAIILLTHNFTLSF